MRKVNIIILILCASAIFANGCAKQYHQTIKKPNGEILLTIDYDSYFGGDQTYSSDVEFYPDGSLKRIAAGFSRNITGLVGVIMDGIFKLAGAAGNKF